jgi:CBS domain-containing protein
VDAATTAAAVLKQKGAAVISVSPGTPVPEAAEIVARHRIGAIVILDDAGRLQGILSERDVVRGLTQRGAGLLDMQVEALMTHDVRVATAQTTVSEAMEIMDTVYFRHLPVVDPEGSLCGIVSNRDLVRHRITAQQSDVDSLQAYVMGRGYAIGHV